jgi:hypothetical protein
MWYLSEVKGINNVGIVRSDGCYDDTYSINDFGVCLLHGFITTAYFIV